VPNAAFSVQWTGLSEFDRLLGNFEAKKLQARADKAFGLELRPLTGHLKSAEQSSGIHNRTGEHLKKIRLRKNRKRAGEMAAWTTGPSDKKKHLLVRGHEIVTPGGRHTGKRTRAFPYVDPVIDREAGPILERIASDVWTESLKA
jgi:hypothetical protein